MNIKVFIIGFIFLIFNTLYAESLDAKIAKLSSVPKEQRYILINSIKRDLAKLNREQRVKAIAALKDKLNKKHRNMHQNRYGKKLGIAKGFKNNLKFKSGILHLHKGKHKCKNKKHKIDNKNIKHNKIAR